MIFVHAFRSHFYKILQYKNYFLFSTLNENIFFQLRNQYNSICDIVDIYHNKLHTK
jgi:hypothetical protein